MSRKIIFFAIFFCFGFVNASIMVNEQPQQTVSQSKEKFTMTSSDASGNIVMMPTVLSSVPTEATQIITMNSSSGAHPSIEALKMNLNSLAEGGAFTSSNIASMANLASMTNFTLPQGSTVVKTGPTITSTAADGTKQSVTSITVSSQEQLQKQLALLASQHPGAQIVIQRQPITKTTTYLNGSTVEQPTTQQIKTTQLPSTVQTVTKVIEIEKVPTNLTTTTTTHNIDQTSSSHTNGEVQTTSDKTSNHTVNVVSVQKQEPVVVETVAVKEPAKVQPPAQTTNLRTEDEEQKIEIQVESTTQVEPSTNSDGIVYKFGFESPIVEKRTTLSLPVDGFLGPIEISNGSTVISSFSTQFAVLRNSNVAFIQAPIKLSKSTYLLKFNWRSEQQGGELEVFHNHKIIESLKSTNTDSKTETIEISGCNCCGGINHIKFQVLGASQIWIDNIQIVSVPENKKL